LSKDEIDYWQDVIENKLHDFIVDDLFSWGYWDGEDLDLGEDEDAYDRFLDNLQKKFKIKVTVEYVGD